MRMIPIKGLNAIAWTMTIVGILLTAGRFWIHWHKNRRFGWDDYLNGIAVLFLLVFTITFQIFMPIEYNAQLYAMGQSDHMPSGRDATLDFKLSLVNGLMVFCVIYSVKASFLALYWNIFEYSRRFRMAWGLTAIYTVLSFLASFLAMFWHCGSPRDSVNREACQLNYSRQRLINVLTTWCVLNVVGDLLLMILPIAMLKGMLMRTSQKVGLALVFSLVLVDIAFDILRTVYTAEMKPEFLDKDSLWAILEPTIAVIVCALPCYRHYLSWNVSRGFTSFINSFQSRSFVAVSEPQLPTIAPESSKLSRV
ncbi:hypothetical protein CC78DRAFT_585327 [Lojkania enalia]|uniref:Rhodopsin domain-containing protein n=1 Tax=Lojkania enalia TaxID=147567 RepID=A0A9P4K1W6_9PLEO|nr:hypothetical protein CC78DRAFT_585327 [Didymosphaeria enalia]